MIWSDYLFSRSDPRWSLSSSLSAYLIARWSRRRLRLVHKREGPMQKRLLPGRWLEVGSSISQLLGWERALQALSRSTLDGELCDRCSSLWDCASWRIEVLNRTVFWIVAEVVIFRICRNISGNAIQTGIRRRDTYWNPHRIGWPVLDLLGSFPRRQTPRLLYLNKQGWSGRHLVRRPSISVIWHRETVLNFFLIVFRSFLLIKLLIDQWMSPWIEQQLLCIH